MKKKLLIIGSGPIVIGQAAEFDYSGTQACLAAKEEGYSVVLVNSNPATIQTDREIADTVYLEPLNSYFLEKIIKKEGPFGVLANVGGQTALNLVTDLDKKGILKKYNVRVMGTSIDSISNGEDRLKFRELMEKIGEPVLPSRTIDSSASALKFCKEVGFPVILRSAFTLGGTGGGIVKNKDELGEKLEQGINSSPIKQVLIEKGVIGWAEFEYEMVRDSAGNCICVCNMENIDPMGVHTGDSIVVAPSQTLSNDDYQLLRDAALRIVSVLKIEGACNVQFAFNQETGEYFVIEVNPRLSRSSALASKATGYPIARIATKIALGKTLPEIKNDMTGKSAFFEPALDYLVVKIPRWPHDKFHEVDDRVGITMKSTGEVMAIGRSFEEAMLKAIKSLDIKTDLYRSFKKISKEDLEIRLLQPNVQRLSAIFTAFNKSYSDEQIKDLTKINIWFIKKLRSLYKKRIEVERKINVFKMVDTCAGEFEAKTPYFYSSSGIENEATPLSGKKVIILGSGPIRIGQGVEFDYLTVHAIKALKRRGIKAIVINNNPETVSTDYAISDRLYFEPLTIEFVMKVIENEKEGLMGVIAQFGGQTAINLVEGLNKRGVKILGTDIASIEKAEDRKRTAEILHSLGYEMPEWTVVLGKKALSKGAKKFEYPVLIRPSYVLGGEGMIIAEGIDKVLEYIAKVPEDIFKRSILIDKFLEDAIEVDIDFVSDGERVISFITEQLNNAGIHSGDSSCVYPAQRLSRDLVDKLTGMTIGISRAFGIVGMANLQVAIQNERIFVLEINPRGSRTVPFVSKCIKLSLVKLAVDVILGYKLPLDLEFNTDTVGIKTPVFSFEKLKGINQTLGPLMKSTGESMSVGADFEEALSKLVIGEEKENMNIYNL